MRTLLILPLILAAPAIALAQPDSKPTVGQCRNPAGQIVPCASGAATTDSEAVPLGAKAKVMDDVSKGVTPQVPSAAPRMVPARCQDGAYDVGRTKTAACASHDGVAPPQR